jgi:hypothetical protein
MRKFLLSAAALAGIVAPGVAAAQDAPVNIGYIGLDYANVDVDGVGSGDAVGVSGSLVMAEHFAMDVAVANNDEETAWGATGHIFMNNDQFLLGGFLGLVGSGATTRFGGVEGQLYLNRFTLAGAVSYSGGDDDNVSAWGGNAEGRFFVTDNFRLSASAGWSEMDDDVADDSLFRYGAGAEFQFSGVPISVGAGYSHTEFDETDIEADTVTATVRYDFGGSLLVRDRSGGGLAGLSGVTSASGF